VSLPRPLTPQLRSLLDTLCHILLLARQPDLVREAECVRTLLDSERTTTAVVESLIVRVLTTAHDEGVMVLLLSLLGAELERNDEPNPLLAAASPLFEALVAEPAENSVRLVLADWLDERTASDHGRFIRASVHAATLTGPARAAALRDLHDLCNAALVRRFAAIGFGPVQITHLEDHIQFDGPNVTVRIGPSSGTYSRGLLARLNLPLNKWVAVARTVLETNPLEAVTLANVPGVSFEFDPPAGPRGWVLRARRTTPAGEVVALREFTTRAEFLTGAARASVALFAEVQGM
jgi:uncharacterized protein (TIGR02996 family)